MIVVKDGDIIEMNELLVLKVHPFAILVEGSTPIHHAIVYTVKLQWLEN